MIRASGNGRLKPGDDFGDMRAVKLVDGCVELCAFFTFDEEFGDFGATFHVLWLHLADFTFLRGPLGLCMGWPEGILRPLFPVFLECFLGLCMPHLALIMRHVLPSETNDLG